eukprot:3084068-Amphidinium_carterae.1
MSKTNTRVVAKIEINKCTNRCINADEEKSKILSRAISVPTVFAACWDTISSLYNRPNEVRQAFGGAGQSPGAQ